MRSRAVARLLPLSGLLALLVPLGGCTGIESDIQRAEVREFFLDLVHGQDRGAGAYARQIDAAISKIQGGRYQYLPPAHISHFLVERSVRSLGGTRIVNSDYLAFVAYKLLYVLRYDPMGSTRSIAAQQLGRILLRLPRGPAPPLPGDPMAEASINQIAKDLDNYAREIEQGGRVKTSQVLERLRVLAAERPTSARSAHQRVRAVAVEPVAWSSSREIRALSEEVVPGIVRDAALLALRQAACGDPDRPALEADPSAFVRTDALRVLARLRSPVALDAALARLGDPLDPGESDPDVRGELLAYLGEIGTPAAFLACVQRLQDVDTAVRYHAQKALVRMTGARVRPEAEAWRAWRARHPAPAPAEGSPR